MLRLFPEMEEISDAGLRGKVADAWLLALEESQWARIEDEPWIPGRAEFITNVQHCRGVARIGMAVARILLEGSDIAPGAAIDLKTNSRSAKNQHLRGEFVISPNLIMKFLTDAGTPCLRIAS